MKAVLCDEYGSPDVLKLVDLPAPEMKPGHVRVSIRAAGVNFQDINGNGVWDQDMGIAGLGNPGDVVVYTVSYPWQIMTPVVQGIIGNTFNISARTVVRNEPYNGG